MMTQKEIDLLGPRERFAVKLEIMLKQAGYSRIDFAPFDEYELFDKNRAFVGGLHLLTFTDSFGTLMALRPDVTLSAMKQAAARPEKSLKLYYHEDVFRYTRDTHQYQAHQQIGCEVIRKDRVPLALPVLSLAQQVLMGLPSRTVLVLSHVGFLQSDSWYQHLEEDDQNTLLDLISRKMQKELADKLSQLGCPDKESHKLRFLAGLSGSAENVYQQVLKEGLDRAAVDAAKDLAEKADRIEKDDDHTVVVDFSLVNPLNFYNGLVFQGFARGCWGPVLSGGRYDLLARKFLKGEDTNAGAIGFAADLDALSPLWD
jgi:ATP phosphoribosyltransferase regulatory subunit